MDNTIAKAILAALLECGKYTMKEKTLLTEVRGAVSPTPTDTEIKGQIRRLEGECYIVPARDPLGEVRWSITTDGQAAAKQMGM